MDFSSFLPNINYQILAQSKFEHHFADITTPGNHNLDPEVSDSESGVVGSNYQENTTTGLMRLNEDDSTYGTISKKFKKGLGVLGLSTQVEAIHKQTRSGFIKQAKHQSFLLFSKAMEKKCGGNGNLKYAWFGASEDEINNIFSHGFVRSSNNGDYGHAICLSPDDNPLDCVQNAVPDKNGIRHVMLCRVILGRSEFVQPGSGQCYPSSVEFDTGVDDLVSPRKYIVWNCHINTYVYPEFMVSFRVIPHVKEIERNAVPVKNPKSPWVSFPALISALSRLLPPHAVKLITKYHSDYKERKITREKLIQLVRKLAGDELLTAIIKCCKNKQNVRSIGTSSNSSSINSQHGDGTNTNCACHKSG